MELHDSGVLKLTSKAFRKIYFSKNLLADFKNHFMIPYFVKFESFEGGEILIFRHFFVL